MAEALRVTQVYGTTWCPDCERARRLLDAHGVRYDWQDVDQNPAAAARVQKLNHGMRSVPTIVFPDGSILSEPSNRQLLEKIAALRLANRPV
jgi:mycoredoxin